jgi:hypothetical protein
MNRYNSEESINPFTGMSNIKSMQLQNQWTCHLKNEFNVSMLNIDTKFKKSSLQLPNEYNGVHIDNSTILYNDMTPSAIPFAFTIVI